MYYEIDKIEINNNIYNIIKIENDNNFKVSLLDHGASIYSIFLNDKLLTVCGKDLRYHLYPGSPFGKTIGRIAGRIENANIDIDGVNYKLEKSRFSKDTLHCGSSNFGDKKFDFQIKEYEDKIDVVFSYISLESEANLPGDVDVKVIYTVYKDKNNIKINYVAKSSKNTYLNITNHTYYNLSGNFRSGIENHYIKLNANKMAKSDDDLNPQDIIDCKGLYNLNEDTLLKKNLFTRDLLFRKNRGYDDVFLLNDNSDFAASVYSPYSNIRMNMYTSYPGLILYTGAYPAFMEQVVEVENKLLFDSFCLEAQYIPNGYNIFDEKYMYLEANKEYNHYIEIEFLKDGN